MSARERAERPAPQAAKAPRRTPRPARSPAVIPAGSPPRLSPGEALALQRTLGNRAVSRLVDENEPAPVQRSSVEEVLSRPGIPLAAPVRAEMEARLGADFSGVRLHTGQAARESAAGIGARAYTSGDHVVIGDGGGDKHTLAHELTHVIQQRQGPVAGTDNGSGLRISDPGDRFEREAVANAARALSGRPADGAGPPSAARTRAGEEPVVQRAVGFEFEAQWNVRKVENPEEADAKAEQARAAREFVIRQRILIGAFGHPKERSRLELTKEENEMSNDKLLELAVEGGALTEKGQEWYGRLNLTPEQRENKILQMKYNMLVSDEPLAGENLGKHAPIVEAKGFDLTADSSPAGGSNLEWVTHPLTDEGELSTVMGNVVAMIQGLNERKTDKFIPSEEVKDGGGDPVPRLRIYPDGNQLSFSPQMTAGMKLGHLPKLARYLENRGEQASPWLKRVLSWLMPVLSWLMPRRAADLKRADAQQRQASADQEQATVDLGRFQVFDISRAETAVKDYLEEMPGGKELSARQADALVGLVSLLASYIRGGEMMDNDNSKALAALMSRTNFVHNFSLLPKKIKATFVDDKDNGPEKFADLVLRAAGRKDGGDNRLFGIPVGQGLVGQRKVTTIKLTRREWLENIPRGTDLLRSREEGHDPAYEGQEAVHKSFGSLKPEDLSSEEQKMVVVEFRRMKDKLSVEQLTPVAMAAFKLIRQLNRGEDLHYQK